MNTAGFLADFVRRVGCTIDVQLGREFTAMGQTAARGSACADCGDCARDFGDMGLAMEGVAIVQTIDGLHLSWACPGCNRETVEDTTLFGATAQAKATMQDPLCYSCRRKV